MSEADNTTDTNINLRGPFNRGQIETLGDLIRAEIKRNEQENDGDLHPTFTQARRAAFAPTLGDLIREQMLYREENVSDPSPSFTEARGEVHPTVGKLIRAELERRVCSRIDSPAP